MIPPVDVTTITSKLEIARILGIPVPEEFICPITLEIMEHPMLTRAGFRFERKAIIEWIQNSSSSSSSSSGGTCPLTRQPMSLRDIVSDRTLQNKIEFWIFENQIPCTTIKKQRTKGPYDDDENENENDNDDDFEVDHNIIVTLTTSNSRKVKKNRRTVGLPSGTVRQRNGGGGFSQLYNNNTRRY